MTIYVKRYKDSEHYSEYIDADHYSEYTDAEHYSEYTDADHYSEYIDAEHNARAADGLADERTDRVSGGGVGNRNTIIFQVITQGNNLLHTLF